MLFGRDPTCLQPPIDSEEDCLATTPGHVNLRLPTNLSNNASCVLASTKNVLARWAEMKARGGGWRGGGGGGDEGEDYGSS